MEYKIDLDAIMILVEERSSGGRVPIQAYMKEAIHQTLVLASEKAELIQEHQDSNKGYKVLQTDKLGFEYNIAGSGGRVLSIKTSKQSILGIEKLIVNG